MSRIKVLDLFSGAGGLTLGAHQAGFESVAAIEIDKDLSHSFSANFPNTKLINKDIRSVSGKALLSELPSAIRNLNGIVGGPPCQGFSFIGKRSISDPRNNLIFEYFRLVDELRPEFFVLENVPGILTPPFDVVLEKAMSKVSRHYNFYGPIVLDAGQFGAATKRKRVVVVGIQGAASRLEKLKRAVEVAGGKTPTTVRQAISDLPSPSHAELREDGLAWAKCRSIRSTNSNYARKLRELPNSGIGSISAIAALKSGWLSGFNETHHAPSTIQRFNTTPVGTTEKVSRCPRLDWNKPCSTLRAGTGRDKGSFQAIRPIHPNEPRVITVREAARIQGFPDWFQFHPTKWHSFRMIGNSVSPIMAAALFSSLMSIFTK